MGQTLECISREFYGMKRKASSIQKLVWKHDNAGRGKNKYIIWKGRWSNKYNSRPSEITKRRRCGTKGTKIPPNEVQYKGIIDWRK